MPEIFKNPSLLTKDRLKSDLKANGIPLPKSDQKKDFYVQLYLQHLSPRKQASGKRSDFSSDEEDIPSPRSRRKSNLSTKRKPVLYTKEKSELPFNVKALSDGDLARQLRAFGKTPGPLTETTRPLYQKKLARLLAEEAKSSSKQTAAASKSADSNEYMYSDSDVEEEREESDEPMEVDEEESKKSSEEDSKESADDHLDAPPFPPRTNRRRTVETRTTVHTTRAATRQSLGRQNLEAPVQRDEQPVAVVKRGPAKKSDSKAGFLSSHWKLLLFLHLLVILIAVLVYFYMEGNPLKPRISRVPPKRSVSEN